MLLVLLLLLVLVLVLVLLFVLVLVLVLLFVLVLVLVLVLGALCFVLCARLVPGQALARSSIGPAMSFFIAAKRFLSVSLAASSAPGVLSSSPS